MKKLDNKIWSSKNLCNKSCLELFNEGLYNDSPLFSTIFNKFSEKEDIKNYIQDIANTITFTDMCKRAELPSYLVKKLMEECDINSIFYAKTDFLKDLREYPCYEKKREFFLRIIDKCNSFEELEKETGLDIYVIYKYSIIFRINIYDIGISKEKNRRLKETLNTNFNFDSLTLVDFIRSNFLFSDKFTDSTKIYLRSICEYTKENWDKSINKEMIESVIPKRFIFEDENKSNKSVKCMLVDKAFSRFVSKFYSVTKRENASVSNAVDNFVKYLNVDTWYKDSISDFLKDRFSDYSLVLKHNVTGEEMKMYLQAYLRIR